MSEQPDCNHKKSFLEYGLINVWQYHLLTKEWKPHVSSPAGKSTVAAP